MSADSLRDFSAKAMLENVAHLRDIISRIRQQEGGVGSVEDEMALHRALYDLDLLVDIADGLKAAHQNLERQHHDLGVVLEETRREMRSAKEGYENILKKKDEEIETLKQNKNE